MLLWRFFHTFQEQFLELTVDLLGLTLKFVEELTLFVFDLAIREEHSS
jgi:hypothetical protein